MMVEMATADLSNLPVPDHKVFKPPRIVHELKTILFGS